MEQSAPVPIDTSLTKKRKRSACQDKLSGSLYYKKQKFGKNEAGSTSFEMLIKQVLENVKSKDLEIADDIVEEENLLDRQLLNEACNNAKLMKNAGNMNTIPLENLLNFLLLLEINIRVDNGSSLLSQRNNFRNEVIEKRMAAIDSSLICLNIMTSENMPKRIYMEEVLERIFNFIHNQIHNTIFPFYDSSYRLGGTKDFLKNKDILKKDISEMYSKMIEALELMIDLICIQKMPDSAIQVTVKMCVSSFFMENINKLQFIALKLLVLIFSKCDTTMRTTILKMLLDLIATLPSKCNKFGKYRKNNGDHMLMFTSLILQLIQSATFSDSKEPKLVRQRQKNIDFDKQIRLKYTNVMITAQTFFKEFLHKSVEKIDNIDCKALLENLIKNLLSAAHKPEWPAADMLLGMLSGILETNIANVEEEISVRLVSLELLGLVAVELRKSKLELKLKIAMVNELLQNEATGGDRKIENLDADDVNIEDERIDILQRCLLNFLKVNLENDDKNAIDFHIIQWYMDCVKEINVSNNTKSIDVKCGTERKSGRKKSNNEKDIKFRLLEKRKQYLSSQLTLVNNVASDNNNGASHVLEGDQAIVVTEFLASQRSFARGFMHYLTHILFAMRDATIAIRTRAMKCLTSLVETDSEILDLNNVQLLIKSTFLDQSASVRETAVIFLGKFVTTRPQVLATYSDMLTARLTDASLNVRKHAIRVCKEIAIQIPEFDGMTELSHKILRRITDEESIQRLVLEFIQNLWFKFAGNADLLDRKLEMIVKVVEASDKIGLDSLERVLMKYFKLKKSFIESESWKDFIDAYEKIIDKLLDNINKQQRTNINDCTKLFNWFKTLQLLAAHRPQFLLSYIARFIIFLRVKEDSFFDSRILCCIIQILDCIVPHLSEDDENLSILQKEIIGLIDNSEQAVVQSCISLLRTIDNEANHINFKLILDCFNCHISHIYKFTLWLEEGNIVELNRSECQVAFRRALCIIGNLLKHFDFTGVEHHEQLVLDKNMLFDMLMSLIPMDKIQLNITQAIKPLCIRHPDFLLDNRLKDFFKKQLISNKSNSIIIIEILSTIRDYLSEESERLIRQESNAVQLSKKQSLKEMCDTSSLVASSIIQTYLEDIIHSYLTKNLQIRQLVQYIIKLALEQGLVQPVGIVPYLICMATDVNKAISYVADQLLLEIETKYPRFIQSKSSLGLWLSYTLQKVINNDSVRGYQLRTNNKIPTAVNSYFYSLIRKSRLHRRSFLMTMLKMFDNTSQPNLSYMLYLADNMATFPYQVQDEPLFIFYQIDTMVSTSGTNILQRFREGLLPSKEICDAIEAENGREMEMTEALDENEDEQMLLSKVPDDLNKLQQILKSAQGYLLLLQLRKYLKNIYRLNDKKFILYSPSQPGHVYEKPIVRKSDAIFHPQKIVEILEMKGNEANSLEDRKKSLIQEYIDFKQLLMDLDADEMHEINDCPMENETSSVVEKSVVKTPKIVRLQKRNSSARKTPQKKIKTVKRSRKSPVIANSDEGEDTDEWDNITDVSDGEDTTKNTYVRSRRRRTRNTFKDIDSGDNSVDEESSQKG